MRTDSTNLSKVAQAQILSFVEKNYGKEYVSANIYKTKSKTLKKLTKLFCPTHVEVMHAGNRRATKAISSNLGTSSF